jgi:hypothetical protein
MVAEMNDAPGWGEGRMGVTARHFFDVLNRVKPTNDDLTRLFTINSLMLTMVNDKNTTGHKNADIYSEF